MALNTLLVALTCTVAFPAAALAQSPVQKVAAKPDCCAADEGSAAAAAVLLPPVVSIAADGCCQTDAKPAQAEPVHPFAHLARPAKAAEPGPTNHAIGAMACCEHDMKQVDAKAGDGCCKDMKDGCGVGCCGAPPERR